MKLIDEENQRQENDFNQENEEDLFVEEILQTSHSNRFDLIIQHLSEKLQDLRRECVEQFNKQQQVFISKSIF